VHPRQENVVKTSQRSVKSTATDRGDKKFPDFNVIRELDVSELARAAGGETVIQIVKESSLKRSSDAM
jgi:hypothetical protein